MNKKAIGSYITIKPLELDGLWRGRVVVDNNYKGLQLDDIVFYMESDLKEIIISGDKFHIVLYYHIVYKEDRVINPSITIEGERFQFKELPFEGEKI